MADAVAFVRTPEWEEKHARAMQRVEMIAKEARTMFRTVGPRVSAAQDESFSFKNCPQCNPPPELYICPACDWWTTEKWRFKNHLFYNPKWCNDRAKQKERKWASKT